MKKGSVSNTMELTMTLYEELRKIENEKRAHVDKQHLKEKKLEEEINTSKLKIKEWRRESDDYGNKLNNILGIQRQDLYNIKNQILKVSENIKQFNIKQSTHKELEESKLLKYEKELDINQNKINFFLSKIHKINLQKNENKENFSIINEEIKKSKNDLINYTSNIETYYELLNSYKTCSDIKFSNLSSNLIKCIDKYKLLNMIYDKFYDEIDEPQDFYENIENFLINEDNSDEVYLNKLSIEIKIYVLNNYSKIDIENIISIIIKILYYEFIITIRMDFINFQSEMYFNECREKKAVYNNNIQFYSLKINKKKSNIMELKEKIIQTKKNINSLNNENEEVSIMLIKLEEALVDLKKRESIYENDIRRNEEELIEFNKKCEYEIRTLKDNVKELKNKLRDTKNKIDEIIIHYDKEIELKKITISENNLLLKELIHQRKNRNYDSDTMSQKNSHYSSRRNSFSKNDSNHMIRGLTKSKSGNHSRNNSKEEEDNGNNSKPIIIDKKTIYSDFNRSNNSLRKDEENHMSKGMLDNLKSESSRTRNKPEISNQKNGMTDGMLKDTKSKDNIFLTFSPQRCKKDIQTNSFEKNKNYLKVNNDTTITKIEYVRTNQRNKLSLSKTEDKTMNTTIEKSRIHNDMSNINSILADISQIKNNNFDKINYDEFDRIRNKINNFNKEKSFDVDSDKNERKEDIHFSQLNKSDSISRDKTKVESVRNDSEKVKFDTSYDFMKKPSKIKLIKNRKIDKSESSLEISNATNYSKEDSRIKIKLSRHDCSKDNLNDKKEETKEKNNFNEKFFKRKSNNDKVDKKISLIEDNKKNIITFENNNISDKNKTTNLKLNFYEKDMDKNYQNTKLNLIHKSPEKQNKDEYNNISNIKEANNYLSNNSKFKFDRNKGNSDIRSTQDKQEFIKYDEIKLPKDINNNLIGKDITSNENKNQSYEENIPDKLILVYNKESLIEKDNYDQFINTIKSRKKDSKIESKGYQSERRFLINKNNDTFDNILSTKYKVTDFNNEPLTERRQKSNLDISEIQRSQRTKDEILNSNHNNYFSKNKLNDSNLKNITTTTRIPMTFNDRDGNKLDIPLYKNRINMVHENSNKPEFIIAEKLYALLEGTVVYKRNLFIKKHFDEYKMISNSKISKPEDYGFREYFCFIDKAISKISFNKIKNEDKSSEFFLSSLTRIGVPKITKNMIFIKQIYNKIYNKNIPESQVNKYITMNSDKLIKLYNKGVKNNELNVEDCLYNDEYRQLMLKANYYMLYIYLKEEIRLEIIFKDYEDFKHWINGLEDLIRKKDTTLVKLVRQKIID